MHAPAEQIARLYWMPGTRPGMTAERVTRWIPGRASLVRDDAKASLRGALGEDALERAPMHVEPPCGLGDVTVA
jgi:hypothetical protein